MRSKTIDRLTVVAFDGKIGIEQTHRNRDLNNKVGSLMIDSYDDLKDLQHALEWAERNVFREGSE